MSSTALSVYPHLPPTTNLLNSQQRTRLMRSTRKLGAVLGTTPYLLENEVPFTILPLGKTTSKALKRQGSIFAHRQASSLSVISASTTSSHLPSPSTSSLNLPRSATPSMQNTESHPVNPPGLTTQKRRPRDKPPQLHLQLNDCFASSLSLSPSPSPSPCPSPITPTIPDPTEIRRKRMAKLARHLGEKIPVELVLNSELAPKQAAVSLDHHPRRRSKSVHVLHDDVVNICGNMPPKDQLHPKHGFVGEWNRTDIRDVQKELRNLKTR